MGVVDVWTPCPAERQVIPNTQTRAIWPFRFRTATEMMAESHRASGLVGKRGGRAAESDYRPGGIRARRRGRAHRWPRPGSASNWSRNAYAMLGPSSPECVTNGVSGPQWFAGLPRGPGAAAEVCPRQGGFPAGHCPGGSQTQSVRRRDPAGTRRSACARKINLMREARPSLSRYSRWPTSSCHPTSGRWPPGPAPCHRPCSC